MVVAASVVAVALLQCCRGNTAAAHVALAVVAAFVGVVIPINVPMLLQT